MEADNAGLCVPAVSTNRELRQLREIILAALQSGICDLKSSEAWSRKGTQKPQRIEPLINADSFQREAAKPHGVEARNTQTTAAISDTLLVK